ncbi:MAG: class III signal peptide-containing protein [Candidatus Micrarchaeota archaeon]
MKNKGQGAFEYVLLLAGVLLIVVLAVVLLRGGLGGAGDQQIQYNMCKNELASSGECWYANGSVNPFGGIPVPMPPSCKAYEAEYCVGGICSITCADLG